VRFCPKEAGVQSNEPEPVLSEAEGNRNSTRLRGHRLPRPSLRVRQHKMSKPGIQERRLSRRRPGVNAVPIPLLYIMIESGRKITVLIRGELSDLHSSGRRPVW